MESKSIIVGLIIGIVVGGFIGFLSVPSRDVSDFQSQIDDLEVDISNYRLQVDGLQQQVSNLQNDINNLQVSLQTKNSEISRLQNELENTISKEEYSAIEQEISQLQIQITNLQNQLNEKNTTIEELQKTIDDLESILPLPPPSEGEPGSSRFFPVDIGITISCVYVNWRDETYYANITLLEIIRGSSAWSMIKDANMFNDPPPEGFEYILVKIKFKYAQGPDINAAWDIRISDFDAVSEDGYVYDSTYIVEPEPEFSAELYPGASHEGWAAYHVKKTDDKPVLGWKRGSYGKGGFWFKLYTD